jgi:REP element-mobilizing transposase RayT
MVVLKEMDVNSAEVLILFEAHDKDKAKEIENKLKEHKTYKLNELRDYTANPDNERQYYIVEESEIIVEQQYVFWAVNSQSEEINNIIKDYIENNK